MTSVDNESLNLLQSTPYKILREGDATSDLIAKLKTLKQQDNARFNKLFGICSRLEFVEQLRYTPDIAYRNDPKLAAFQYNTERLCAYLTTTCIEIAATQHYQLFPDWLKNSLKPKSLDSHIASAIQELTLANSEDLVKTLLVKWTKILHDEDYKNALGLNRSFKRFFEDLPEWMTRWLGDIYFIEDGEILESWADHSKSNWLNIDYRARVRTISDYLYTQIRNKHTHTVNYYPTLENGGILGIKFLDNDYTFNMFYKDGILGKKVELSVGIKKGFTESDVLRFIIVFTLRKWLGIVDDSSLTRVYWDRAIYRKLAYRLLQELNRNMKVIEWWCARHLHSNTLQFSYSIFVGNLPSKEANAMMEHLSNKTDNAIYNDTRQYLMYLNMINQKISNFNSQQEEHKGTFTLDCGELITEITRSDEMNWLVYNLKNIEQVLLQLIDFSIY